MPLILARVDDRLIHGQVVVGWARALNADCLVVANDAVAADPMQRTLLPMAVPPQMKVGIHKVEEAAAVLRSGRYEDRRIILLVSSVPDALALVRSGLEIRTLNVGGVRQAPGRMPLRTAVALSAAEAQAVRDLIALGVEVQVQMVPGDDSEAIGPVLDAAFPPPA